MPTVSVIVPVYKAEKYIESCIVSILSQTYGDLELILIEDGSPDCSGEICDTWAKKDSRILVIHKENGGASSARNTGLEQAKGRYVCFCDADDALIEDALAKMICEMQHSNAQLVIGDLSTRYTGTPDGESGTNKKKMREYRCANVCDADDLYALWEGNNMHSACGKLYCRDVIEENHIRFCTDMIVMEDYAFVIDYISKCMQICMIPDAVYLYLITDQGIKDKRARLDFFDDILAASEKLNGFLSRFPQAYADKYQQETIYPTLRFAYELLWTREANSNRCKLKKYRRIARVFENETAQKMFVYYKDHYGRMEYYFIRKKNIVGILAAHGLQRIKSALS